MYLFIYIFIAVQLLHNAVLFSVVQQSESAVYHEGAPGASLPGQRSSGKWALEGAHSTRISRAAPWLRGTGEKSPEPSRREGCNPCQFFHPSQHRWGN